MKTVIEMAKDAGFPFNKFGLLQGDDKDEIDADAMFERLVELVRADEREAMATEAAKQGWAMKNEDPFEDAVREIAAIRARSNT